MTVNEIKYLILISPLLKNILFYMHGCLFCQHVCLCTTYVPIACVDQENMSDLLELVIDCCELSCRCRESNL